jgi:hypothetical protein
MATLSRRPILVTRGAAQNPMWRPCVEHASRCLPLPPPLTRRRSGLLMNPRVTLRQHSDRHAFIASDLGLCCSDRIDIGSRPQVGRA